MKALHPQTKAALKELAGVVGFFLLFALVMGVLWAA